MELTETNKKIDYINASRQIPAAQATYQLSAPNCLIRPYTHTHTQNNNSYS